MKLNTRETKTRKYRQIHFEIRNNWNIFDLGFLRIDDRVLTACGMKLRLIYEIESLKIVFEFLSNFQAELNEGKMQIICQNTL